MTTNETPHSPQQQPPSPPPHQQQLRQPPRVYEMDMHPPVTDEEQPSTLWDWGDLLDFPVDDQFTFSFDSDHHPTSIPPAPETSVENQNPTSDDNSDRIRKRDPRLTCENFLAGRIPCSCPEIDEMLAEEEEEEVEREVGHGKKRARTARAPAGTARCQVPGCGVDITELKGYHRRHRVCLRCANAAAVLIEGQSKRYCQQCGKFHVLSDFDEDKRSCRRKLERHNNRRRRKAIESKGSLEKEPQEDHMADDISCGAEAEKDNICLSNQSAEKDVLVESEDGHVSTLCSTPGSKNVQGDSVVSFVASDETQIDGKKDTHLPSYSDSKSAYSSTCPTGRISFKLYDWNPAEFPRRLRHQIFQWLASMPVELEGYIRPGCTILTAFIAMPQTMWVKLLENPASYLHDFVVAPGMLLSGKGTVLVYLNNKIFCAVKDGKSVVEVKKEVMAPRIHYVHPTFFEAGKPMEFVVCGSNLLQSKFRFLVSFAGKYLANKYYVSFPEYKTEGDPACSFEHQLYNIYVPHTEPDLFGPAFVEIENEAGLSNFIPILIGDKDICSEMKIIQHSFDASLSLKKSHVAANTCEVSVLRQTTLSDFISDLAWLLKEPASGRLQNSLTSSQIQGYNCLLKFLICNDSITSLDKVLQSLKILMNSVNKPISGTDDIDIKLFQKNVDLASDILCKNLKKNRGLFLQSQTVPKGDQLSQNCSKDDILSFAPNCNQDKERKLDGKFGQTAAGLPLDGKDKVPLLNGEVIMNVSHTKELPRKSSRHVFSTTGVVLGTRPTIFVIAIVVICFGVCAVLLHPHKVGKFAVSIRRCVFDNL